jgi:hypothetical protein
MPSDDIRESLMETYEKLYPTKIAGLTRVEDGGPTLADMFVDENGVTAEQLAKQTWGSTQPAVQHVNPPLFPTTSGQVFVATGGGGGNGGSIIMTASPTYQLPISPSTMIIDETTLIQRVPSPTSFGGSVPLKTYVNDTVVIDERQIGKIKCNDGVTRSLEEWFTWKLAQQLRYYIKPNSFHGTP